MAGRLSMMSVAADAMCGNPKSILVWVVRCLVVVLAVLAPPEVLLLPLLLSLELVLILEAPPEMGLGVVAPPELVQAIWLAEFGEWWQVVVLG